MFFVTNKFLLNGDPHKSTIIFPLTSIIDNERIGNIKLIQSSQSSNYSSVTIASKALDGTLTMNFDEGPGCALTNVDESDPWWKAAIAKPHLITKVRIYPRRDCCQDRYVKVTVSTSLDGTTWDQCSDLDDTLKTATGWVDAVCPANTIGKYVKVILHGLKKDLGVCEVEALGYPGKSTSSFQYRING